jgi:hypothetical protein
MRTSRITAQAVTAAVVALAAIRYRHWHLRWGATDDELAMPLPGDEMVQHPHFAFTRAITIRARPEEIYPWLVQIGWGRAGWYSYDVLDNLGKHSAEEIIPELQDMKVGDLISMGGKPTETTALRVKAFEPNQWLLWEHQGCPWVWHLEPIDSDTTRLLTRGRNRYRIDWTLPTAVILMEIGDPFMMRQQLLNLKRRAEGLAADRKATAHAASNLRREAAGFRQFAP